MTNQLTREQVEAFLARHKDPADARRFLCEAGLIDGNGKLAKPYRPEDDAMNSLRQASADISGVELRPDWVQRAGRAKLKAKVQAIVDAFSGTEGWAEKALASALREVINQCQNGQGSISSAELYKIAESLEEVVVDDDD